MTIRLKPLLPAASGAISTLHQVVGMNVELFRVHCSDGKTQSGQMLDKHLGMMDAKQRSSAWQ